MIKNKSYFLLLCASLAPTVQAATIPNCASHQFVPRGITTDLVYIDAITFKARHCQAEDENRVRSIFTNTFLYQQSNKSKTLGSAFLLGDGSNSITVAQTAPADVNSLWLGLFNPTTPFSSTFSIAPQSKIFGYHLNWYVNLDSWLCGLWFDLSAAVLNTRNTLHCNEVGNFATQCPGIFNVTSALSNPNYSFGQFFCGTCNGEKRRTALDDLQFRLGYEWSWACLGDGIWGLYFIGTAPAGRKATATYVFEPLVGSKHGSAGVGFDADYQFNLCGYDFSILTDFNYRYVLKHRECRTFDLTPNGPLSRFLLVAPEALPSTPLPGINFFTQNVNTTPGSTIQWWIALNFETCNWDFEVGYNLFWRQREKISSSSLTAFNPDIGIYDLGCIGAGCTSASTATIGTFAPTADATFVPLTTANLNLTSAAAGKVLTNKIYGAVSTNGCVCECIDWIATVGGSYEFVDGSSRCSALSYWAVFGKFGWIF